MEIGDPVIYTDQYGVAHDALVTQKFGGPSDHTAINVVYVSGDSASTDQYGRQLLREVSVVHKDQQSAHGRFYEVV